MAVGSGVFFIDRPLWPSRAQALARLRVCGTWYVSFGCLFLGASFDFREARTTSNDRTAEHAREGLSRISMASTGLVPRYLGLALVAWVEGAASGEEAASCLKSFRRLQDYICKLAGLLSRTGI